MKKTLVLLLVVLGILSAGAAMAEPGGSVTLQMAPKTWGR
jgi:hypothetical protein